MDLEKTVPRYEFQVGSAGGQPAVGQVRAALDASRTLQRRGVPSFGRRWAALSLLDWLLGLALVLPALLRPGRMFWPLIGGLFPLGIGIMGLWVCRRRLLGLLSLWMGALLCTGTLTRPQTLGVLAPLGAAGLAVGITALVSSRAERPGGERQARRLAAAWRAERDVGVRVTLDGREIAWQSGGTVTRLGYDALTEVVETRTLFLLVGEETEEVLLKADLTRGRPEALGNFLSARLLLTRAGEADR